MVERCPDMAIIQVRFLLDLPIENMKRILFLLLLAPVIANAKCNNYIIAFRGLEDAFDKEAFLQYANIKSSCYKIFNWQQVDHAVDFINNLATDYEFYGFSKGAWSVSKTLTKVKHKPKYIITIGAWHTTDVDFSKYNIKFNNFFDHSGRNQKSPGTHIYNVPHMRMQNHINKLMPLWPNW